MLLKNNYMWKNIIFVTLLIPCLAISCTTGPDEKEKINIEGKWEVNGLEQLEINNLNASKEFLSSSNKCNTKYTLRG